MKNNLISSSAETLVSPENQEKEDNGRKKRQQTDLFQKGMKLRIYPNEPQTLLLNQWIGADRFVWNWALGKQKELYQQDGSFLSVKELSRELTKFREEDDKVWLRAVPRTIFSNTLNHLKTSWEGFFDGVKGKRADKPGQPVFRKRGGRRESATFQTDPRSYNPVNFQKKTLRLPGIGEIKAIFSEPVVGEISSITVYRKGPHWFASMTLINVSVEHLCRAGSLEGVPTPKGFSEEKWQKRAGKLKMFSEGLVEEFKENNRKGLFSFDADFKNTAVATSDRKTIYSLVEKEFKEKIKNKIESKENYQRIYSRKMEANYAKAGIVRVDGKWPKGSGKKAKEAGVCESQNLKEIKEKIAQIDLDVSNQKQALFHKFTTEVVRNHHTLVFETLDLQEMAQAPEKNSQYRRNFHEANIGELIRQLKYKAKWYGRNIIFVDKWFASSQQCSECLHKNPESKNKSTWTCSKCGKNHDRDENAAFNLWQEGWRLLQESLQQSSIEMLAAGSAVKGRSGNWMISQKKKTKQKRSLKDQVKSAYATPEFSAV